MSSRKVIDYTIFSDHDIERLVTIVKKELKNGWVLYGFPFSEGEYNKLERDDCCIHQAMVKYAEDN